MSGSGSIHTARQPTREPPASPRWSETLILAWLLYEAYPSEIKKPLSWVSGKRSQLTRITKEKSIFKDRG